MTGACQVKVKCLKTETGEYKIFKTETGLMNYRHDKYMSGESKIFKTETGLMNYRHARCMSNEVTCLKRRQVKPFQSQKN